jgi:hypothetical protein
MSDESCTQARDKDLQNIGQKPDGKGFFTNLVRDGSMEDRVLWRAVVGKVIHKVR